MEQLPTRWNLKDRKKICWLAGTKINFIGSGPDQLPFKQVNKVDVSAACDDIIHDLTQRQRNLRLNLHSSIFMSYGAVRILDKQFDSFYDDCKKSVANLFSSSLETKKSAPKEKEPIIDLPEIEDVDIEKLLNVDGRSDMHLIEENNVLMPNDNNLEFGDECFDEIRRVHSPIPALESLNTLSVLDMFDSADVVQDKTKETPSKKISYSKTPVTPKRKLDKPHDETPTKRNRATPSSTRLYLSPHAHRIREPSEGAKSPVTQVRRSILSDIQATSELQNDSNVQIETLISLHELQGKYQDSMKIAAVPEACSTPTESTKEVLPAPPIEETFEKPVFMPNTPEHITGLEYEVQDNQIEPIPPAADQNEFQLSELNLSLNSLIGRRRTAKKKSVFDEITQISLNKFDTNTHYTRTFQSTLYKEPKKLSTKILLSLPTTGLSITGKCSWGLKLKNQFSDIITTSCGNVVRSDQSSQPRDIHVDKQSRFSRIGGLRSVRSSTPYQTTESSRGIRSTSNHETEKSNFNQNEDAQHMPPPMLPIQDAEQNQDWQQQSPRIHRGVPQIIELPTAASPRQNRRSGAILDHMESVTESENATRAADVPNPEIEPEPEDAFAGAIAALQPRQLKSGVHLELLFQDFEKLWAEAADACMDSDRVHIELDVILNPSKTSINQLIEFLIYCFELEKKGKLHVKQEKAYGPVYIVKHVDE